MIETVVPDSDYKGFEQGPIRPPSEANSLLIRVTRNCPWNHCTFCPVYKGQRFSLRPVSHVLQDIDQVYRHLMALVDVVPGRKPRLNMEKARAAAAHVDPDQMDSFHASWHWARGPFDSVFLQDANSLVIKPADLIRVLTHLKQCFPWVERITAYARSHSVARISDTDLSRLCSAGLNRVHIGMESGCDAVLKRIRKGSDRATQIKAGCKIRSAGIQLSEYVMPGLGGGALSEAHAIDTATALNAIDADFIRLRTLALRDDIPLYNMWQAGDFEKMSDLQMTREIRLLVSHLDGIQSRLVSDHMFNLLQDVEGHLSTDKPAILAVLDRFLDLSPEGQVMFQVGRRLGFMTNLDDLERPRRAAKAERLIREFGITPDNVDGFVYEAVRRFM